MYDLIVIGGGIVGLSVAYHAVAAGAKALLVDRSDPGRATAAGAGILAPETSAIESDAWFRLAVAAVDYYPTLAAQLQADAAGGTGYAATEALVVAVSADEDAAFAAARERMLARQQRYGRPTPEQVTAIDAAQARELFPPLAPIRAGLRVGRAARVDGRLLAGALERAADTRGLLRRTAGVDQIVLQGETASAVVIAGETLTAGSVVIAGGAWSAAFESQLHMRLPVKPQRGQIIHLSLPGVETADWPVILPFHGHYMVPWPDQRVVVGATRELVGFEPHSTAAGVHEVLAEALRVAPGLANATLGEVRVGLRPSTPDSLPVLGRAPTARNVYLATGHGATGLQVGPYSGKLIADLALGRMIEVDLEPFAISRF
ncbi:MAG TPA: FAD-dependent oxidoreductase [Roseiflexaceae bacterium]|nr:FAD-dependent oxidoreductase [Roseiflexaceae bacterium]